MGGLARRSESKTPKYLSKNSNILKILKSYPLNILKVQSEKLSIWDKFSFSLRIVPLIIHKNHFIYPLTIVHINSFEYLFPTKITDPKQSSQPPHIECPPGIIAQYMVKTKFDEALKILVAREKIVELSVANMQCVIPFVLLF